MKRSSAATLPAAFFLEENLGDNRTPRLLCKKNTVPSFSPVLFLSCRAYPAILVEKRY